MKATDKSINVPIDRDRIDIARQSAWHIEALADMLIVALKDAEEIGARSIAVRVKQLACIQMGALSDDPPELLETTDALYLELTGERSTVGERNHG